MIGWAWAIPAFAGAFEGELAADVLHATSTSEVGPQPGFSATEIGMRVRGSVEEGRALFALDYQGREPVGGLFPTIPYRLLYRAELVATLVEDRLELGVGRFIAPSVVFLPVDGIRAVLTPSEELRFEVFGGRRGISTARRNIAFETFLPALGAVASYTAKRGQVELRGAGAGDQVVLGTDGAPYIDSYGSFNQDSPPLIANGQARGWIRPVEGLTLGLAGTLAQNATYTLFGPPSSAGTSGPVGVDPILEIQALDLFQALAWTSVRAGDDLRIDADVLRQTATVRAAEVEADPPDEPTLVDPTFTDFRIRGAGRALDLGWIRPDVRLRLREARTELRYGAGVDLDDLGVPGPIVRGRLFVDDVLAAAPDDTGAVDRLLWSASGGYSRGAIEVEAGASFVDRALAPVSARSSSAVESEDLSPFVLEAQNVVFARGFWTNRRFFGGADLEVSVHDAEVRGFVQLGVLTEAGW